MIRRRYVLTGVVQGVGFRPHVARVALQCDISGVCGNDDESVFIEAQGSPDELELFLGRVLTELPPLAVVETVQSHEIDVLEAETAFVIAESQRSSGALTLIPPDIAPCDACLEEMRDPQNRRYQYPLISCMNCGPRFSVVRELPYDRANTTLADFPMCAECAAEYADPTNRRFHAEPISCFTCGPTVWLQDNESNKLVWNDALSQAKSLVREGKILAVKGVGGYALMCDATNDEAVSRLRERKHRPDKPFALMVADVATASTLVDLSPQHVELISAPTRPIVVLPKKPQAQLSEGVAPGLNDLGIMLPSSPLHHLLVESGQVWIATSANISGDPICYRDEDAVSSLGAIADAFVMNNRVIHVPVEDSVLLAQGKGTIPIRRSRGFAPLPVKIEADGEKVLAVGGELKNTFALTRDGKIFVSAHIGDMGSLATQVAFDRSVGQMMSAHRTKPDLIVADLHPEYNTTAWAERYSLAHDIPLLQVQHHHAHALSLLAEHELLGEEAYIVVCDGTGYGPDGTIWGGEFLHLQGAEFERVWHLPTFLLPGGDSAVMNPWKTAVALLHRLGLSSTGLPPEEFASPAELDLVESQLANLVAVVETSSAGRLCDGVASLLGIRHQVTFEAQAAMELEAQAWDCHCVEHPFAEVGTVEELITALVAQFRIGAKVSCIARYFHEGLARVFVRQIHKHAPAGSILGFTGGVFQNRLLEKEMISRLRNSPQGYRVITHAQVPSNDGGLSLGQASAGVLYLQRGGDVICA